jgi:hypothetical protein
MKIKIVDGSDFGINFRLFMIDMLGKNSEVFKEDLIPKEVLKTNRIILIVGSAYSMEVFDWIFNENTAPVVGIWNPSKYGYMVCQTNDPHHPKYSMLTEGFVFA